jgi:hypothetical protein
MRRPLTRTGLWPPCWPSCGLGALASPATRTPTGQVDRQDGRWGPSAPEPPPEPGPRQEPADSVVLHPTDDAPRVARHDGRGIARQASRPVQARSDRASTGHGSAGRMAPALRAKHSTQLGSELRRPALHSRPKDQPDQVGPDLSELFAGLSDRVTTTLLHCVPSSGARSRRGRWPDRRSARPRLVAVLASTCHVGRFTHQVGSRGAPTRSTARGRGRPAAPSPRPDARATRRRPRAASRRSARPSAGGRRAPARPDRDG